MDNFEQLTALADRTRIAIVRIMGGGRISVGDIAQKLPVSRPAVSQHLKILSTANLIKEERSGTKHYFSLNPQGFAELQDYIASMWHDALHSFAAYVERDMKRDKKQRRKK